MTRWLDKGNDADGGLQGAAELGCEALGSGSEKAARAAWQAPAGWAAGSHSAARGVAPPWGECLCQQGREAGPGALGVPGAAGGSPHAAAAQC